MGFMEDGISAVSGGFSRPTAHRRHSSRSHSHKKRRSRSRSRSRESRSVFGGDDGSRRKKHRGRERGSRASLIGFGDSDDDDDNLDYTNNDGTRGAFFGLGGNGSRSSFFGNSRSSYYKRSSRPGFLQKSYKQLKRLLRDLVHWAKRHPWKVFFLVLMPLVTGGALTALLARFGLRMPPSLERMLGVASRAANGDSLGLVGEAVRMASDLGANGSVRVERERGRSGDFEWDRKSAYKRDEGWGDSLMDMAKRYL